MSFRINQLCRLGAAVALVGAAGAVSGCGFTPLYAAAGVTPQLAAIQVVKPDGRAGFLMSQSLDDELGRDQNTPPRYKLIVAVHETRVPRGITINNEASRYEMDVVANYDLREIKTNAQVTKGIVSVNATYDSASQPYASLAGEQDGERRAAEAAAQRIRLELATFFASPHPVGTVTPADAVTPATYSDVYAAQPIQSPRARAENAAQPGAGDIPDPYATPGSAPGTAPSP